MMPQSVSHLNRKRYVCNYVFLTSNNIIDLPLGEGKERSHGQTHFFELHETPVYRIPLVQCPCLILVLDLQECAALVNLLVNRMFSRDTHVQKSVRENNLTCSTHMQ